MGKGGGEDNPPISVDWANDNQVQDDKQAEMMAMMMQSMAMMSAAAAAPAPPALPALPAIAETLDIDWTDKIAGLAQKMKADYGVERARRHGRGKTVLSSPLLDEESADTTQSVLVGD